MRITDLRTRARAAQTENLCGRFAERRDAPT